MAAQKRHTVAEVYAMFLDLEKQVDKLKKRVSTLSTEQIKLFRKYEYLASLLEKAGILTPVHKIVKGEMVFVYKWLSKGEYKIIKETGFKPQPIPLDESERKILYKILKQRGVNLPRKLIIGRLTPEPYFSETTIPRKVLVKFPVDVRNLYLGSWDIYYAIVETMDFKERRNLVKEFAATIIPAENISRLSMKEASRFLAMVTIPVPPTNIIPSTDYRKYVRVRAESDVGWDAQTQWYK